MIVDALNFIFASDPLEWYEPLIIIFVLIVTVSQIPREVTVKIIKFIENVGSVSFGEDLKFTYKDKRSEVLEEFPESEEVKNALWECFRKTLQSTSAGSDDLNPFRLPEAGKFNSSLFIFFICLARFSFNLGL